MELSDEARQAIDTMAAFVARNGPTFEAMTRAKQQHNPKLAFLFQGHKHHGYYRAKVAELKAAAAAAVKTHQAAGSEEAAKIAHFKAQLLQKVMESRTQLQIKEATFWAIEQQFSTKGCFELVLALQEKALSQNSPETRHRCLLLCSDLLYHGTRLRIQELVSPLFGAIPAICFACASEGGAGYNLVQKLIQIWGSDATLPSDLIQSLRQCCDGFVPPRPLLSDVPPSVDESIPNEENDFMALNTENMYPLPHNRPCSLHIENALQEFFHCTKQRTADGWERNGLDWHYKRAPRWMQRQQRSQSQD